MKDRHPNLQVADIVLLKYSVKYGKDRFRLARILDVRADAHGVVRTVVIGIRNRRLAVREPPGTCRAGLVEMEAPVQRLILILPAQEQPEEIVRPLLERAGGRLEVPGAQGQRPVEVQVQEEALEEIQDVARPRPRRSLRQGQGRRS